MKKWILGGVVFVITVSICWGAADLAYRFLQDKIEQQISRSEGITSLTPISLRKLNDIINSTGAYKKYHRLDPVLGWSIANNAQDGLYTSNGIGIRSTREYSPEKPEGIELRVTAFGDSFTHCDDVANEFTWQRFMEQKDPKLEVMNFGVGGYGTDQAWLRYQRKGKKYNADVVLIGFMVENINRNVNAFVPFYRRLSSPVTKPRFALNDANELVLYENMMKTRDDYIALRDNQREYLQKLGQHDYYYQRLFLSDFDYKPVKLAYYIAVNITDPWVVGHDRQYNTQSESFRVTLKILEEFYQEAKSTGAKPWVVVFPEMEDVARARQNQVKRHQPLLDELNAKNIRFIDVLDGFAAREMLSIGRLFKGHYTKFGNELVADIILEKLERKK